MKRSLAIPIVGLGFLFFACITAAAQVELDGFSLRSTGSFNVGYSGQFSDQGGGSGHSLDIGSDADINGFYYSPNFLSFEVQPYYGRSQANSDFQSLTDSSGVNSSVSIFSGSHFPGSMSYAKNYNSTGQYGVPGSSGLITDGNADNFSINWSMLFPKRPTLNFSYGHGASTNSIYGMDGNAETHMNTFRLASTYQWNGYQLSAGYSHFSGVNDFPSIDAPNENLHTTSRNDMFDVAASHALPMHGTFSTSFSRGNYNYTFTDGSIVDSTGNTDTAMAVATIQPWRRVSLVFDTNYTDDALSNFNQQVVTAGGVVPQSNFGTIRSLLTSGSGLVSITSHLSAQAGVIHQEQWFMGQSYGVTQFNGNANFNYSKPLFGMLHFSIGMVDSATKEGNTGLGLVANVNFARKVGNWELNGNYNYSQNVQTLLVLYTTSSYSYGGSVLRRFGNRSSWFAGYNGAHSGFAAGSDASSRSNSFSTSVSFRRWSFGGSYGSSHGESLLTPTGLIAVPGNLPPDVLLGNQVVAFNGTNYGLHGAVLLLHRISITGSWYKGHSDTLNQGQDFRNSSEMVYSRMQYRFRKLYVYAGFTRFQQSIGATGLTGPMISSYYFGISRWFNLF